MLGAFLYEKNRYINNVELISLNVRFNAKILEGRTVVREFLTIPCSYIKRTGQ